MKTNEQRVWTQEERTKFCNEALEAAFKNYPLQWKFTTNQDRFLGEINKYSGMVADYALREITAALAENAKQAEQIREARDLLKYADFWPSPVELTQAEWDTRTTAWLSQTAPPKEEA